MTTGNEKLGIQLEVEPIQANAEVFAKLKESLDAVMASTTGVAQAQQKTTAAVKETTQELKKQQEAAGAISNSFKSALHLNVEKVELGAAKEKIKRALTELQGVLKKDESLNISFSLQDSLKKDLEKQIRDDKSAIEQYRKEIAALFESISMTESKASAIQAKAAAGETVDTKALEKIKSIEKAYDALDKKIKQHTASQAANAERLGDVTAQKQREEIRLSEALLGIQRQLAGVKGPEGLASIIAQLKMIENLGEGAAKAIDQLNRKKSAAGLTETVAPTLKQTKATAGSLFNTEQVTQMAAMAEQVTAVLTPFITKLNSLEALVFKGTTTKMDTIYTEISKVSRVLESFSQQVERLIGQALSAADKAMAPHQNRDAASKAAREYNAAHKAELQEYASYAKRLNDLAREALKAEDNVRDLSKAPTGPGFSEYLKRAKQELADLTKEFGEVDAKADQLRARLNSERREYMRTRATPAATAPPVAATAAQTEEAAGKIRTALHSIDSTGFGHLTSELEGLKGQFTSILALVTRIGTQLRTLLRSGGFSGVKGLTEGLQAGGTPDEARAAKIAQQKRELNAWDRALHKQGLQLWGTDLVPSSYVTDENSAREKAYREQARRIRRAEAGGGSGGSGGGAGSGGGGGGDDYYNRDYSHLLGPTNQHLRDRNEQDDKILANRIKMREKVEEANRKIKELIRKGQQDEMSEYLGSLKRQGLQYWNGEVIPGGYITNENKARAIAFKDRRLEQAAFQRMGRQQSAAQQVSENLDYKALSYRFTEPDAQVQARKAYIRKTEEEIGAETLAILRNTNRARSAVLREQYSAEIANRKAFIKQMRDLEEENQRKWNQQAGTEGVKYKAFGNGFVRTNMDTRFGTNAGAYNNLYDTEENRTAQTNRNITAAISGVHAASLKGVMPTLESITAALKAENIEIDKLNGKSLAHLNSELKKVHAEVKNGAVAFRAEALGLADVLNKMGRRLVEFYTLRSIIFAIGNEFRMAVTGLMDFNQSLHDTIAIAGAAPTSFKGLEQAALNIAKTTKFSAAEVTEGMKVLAQAGVDVKDLPNVTQVTALLATGSGSTFEQASQVLTTGMNVWKIDAEDSIKIANTFTAALNASKLEIGELGVAFNYLASQSALSGRSLVETTALIATLKNQGQQASTIGTSMSGFLGALLSPTRRVKKYLEDYKIDPKDVDPTKHTLVEIVKAFEDAAKRTGISVKDLFKTFDKRVARGTATLFQAGSDELLIMEERIRNTNAAATAWAESMKGVRAQINILRTEFAATMSDVANKMRALFGIKDVLRNLIVGLRDTQVQAGLAATAIAGIGYALIQLANKNKVAAGLTVLAGILATIAERAGAARRELANMYQTLSQDVAASAGKYQRTAETLSNFLLAVKNAKVDPKTGILAIDKRAYEDMIKLDSRFATNTSWLKDRNKLIEETNKLMHASTEIYNKENDAQLARFNALADKVEPVLEGMRKDYKAMTGKDLPEGSTPQAILEKIDKETNGKSIFGAGQYQVFMNKWKKPAELVETAASENTTTEGVLRGKLGNEPYVKNKSTGVVRFRVNKQAIDAVARMPAVNTESQVGDEKKGFEKPDPEAKLKQYIAEHQERQSKLQKAMAKIDKDIAELDLKDKALTNKEVAEARLEITKAVEDEYAAEAVRIKENTWNKIAKAAGGTYDSEKNVIHAGKGVSQKTLNQAIAKGNEEYQEGLENMNKEKHLMLDKVLDKEETITSRNNEKYEAITKRLQEESLARQLQAESKNLDLALADRSKTWEEKVAAFEKYKEVVAARYEKERANNIGEYVKAAYRAGTPLDVQSKEIAEISTGSNERRDTDIEREKQRLYLAVLMENVEAEERHQDKILRTKLEILNTDERLAWLGKEVNDIEVKKLDAETKALDAKQASYQSALGELEIKRLDAMGKDPASYERLTEQIDKYNDRLDETAARLREIAQLRKEATASNEMNILYGVRDSYSRLSNPKQISREFGSSVTDTAFNGTTESISNALGTVMNPDTEKIKDLEISVSKLRTERLQLLDEIHGIEMNTSKTPAEIASLQDKKIKLEEINNQLGKQSEELSKAKNGWTAFAEGMKDVMKTILQELQRYIAKLLVVWAVEQLVGIAKSMMGGESQQGAPVSDSPLMSSAGQDAFNTDYLSTSLYGKKAGGGLIPLSAGKAGVDSVPLMAMPGEVVIQKSAVDYYGADRLLALNNKKIQKFAEGGLVGGSSSDATSATGDKKNFTLTIINVADPNSVPKMTGEEVINIVSFNAAQKGAVYKTIKGVVSS